jgi:hypothetical protein
MNASFPKSLSPFFNRKVFPLFRASLTGLVLGLCCLCFSTENNSGSKLVLQNLPGAEQLEQKMLSMSEAGGGVLVLPKNSTLTATVRSVTYKARQSHHALLVPEDITLDLNGSTILLDLRSNSYGVRLASRSTIRNGTIRLIRSEGGGSQRIFHAALSVGAAYGDGGTADNPSYFSKIVGWRMENLTIDQPFNHSAIQLMSEAANGVIRDIRIADSKEAPLGIGLDWGTVGPLNMADEKQKEMHALFAQGKLYGTHPHDILIQKIRVGRLTKNENDDGSAAIRTSACYNITIDDVEIKETGVGVALHAGDAGFEYALSPHREIGHAGYVIKNLKVHKAFRKGIIIDGFSDNIYRAVYNHGDHSLLSPVTPGINKPVIQNVWMRGDGFTGDCGITIYYSVGARLENIDVAEFHKGIHIGIWTKDVTVSNSRIHDNKYGMAIKSPEKKPENIVLSHNRYYHNVKDIDKSSLQITEIDNVFKK